MITKLNTRKEIKQKIKLVERDTSWTIKTIDLTNGIKIMRKFCVLTDTHKRPGSNKAIIVELIKFLFLKNVGYCISLVLWPL